MVASFDAFGTVLISRQEGGVGEAQSCEPLRPSGDRGEYVKSGEVFRFPKRKGLALAATVLISIGCAAARAQPVESAARVEADISGLVRIDPPAPEEADPREVDPRPSGGRGRAGEVVPDLEVGTLEGTPISLATLEGKVVILNFWATWCEPCVAEWPQIDRLAERLAEAGIDDVVVLAVSIDKAREDIA
ncbi:MAG: TlpA family protein disulfide reductase, partial [Acidobacteria bacterium]|nr:TlpA family protein disulfide reductase [Acidobacteriota bacterium]